MKGVMSTITFLVYIHMNNLLAMRENK